MYTLMKYISRTHRCAAIYRSDQLKDENLRAGQHIYIFHICKSPGITQEKLAKLICVNKSNVTRHLNALEQAGFINRPPFPDDRRKHMVFPTQKALDIFPRVKKIMSEWTKLLTAELSESEKAELSCLLARIYDRAVSIIGQQNGEG